MVNWRSLESYERLLAAIVAANDNKVDMKRVAHFFGQGATYDAIESRFRKAKKDAKALIAEAEGRAEPKSRADKGAFAASATPSIPSTSKSSRTTKLDSVKSGRVTKSTPKKFSLTAASRRNYAEADDAEEKPGKDDSDNEGVKMEEVFDQVDEEV